MDSLIKELEKPKRFDVFVQEQMKNSTYKPLWKDEIATIDYEASRTYRAAIAEYSAAMVGSVIDKNGEKPTHTMPLLPIQFNGGIIQADNLACVAIVNYGVSFHFVFKC